MLIYFFSCIYKSKRRIHFVWGEVKEEFYFRFKTLLTNKLLTTIFHSFSLRVCASVAGQSISDTIGEHIFIFILPFCAKQHFSADHIKLLRRPLLIPRLLAHI